MATLQLAVLVKEGKNLAAADVNGKSDPYVVVKYNGKKNKTDVRKETLDPVWNETMHFPYAEGHRMTFKARDNSDHVLFSFFIVSSTSACMWLTVFQVWDKDTIGKDEFLGKIEARFSLSLSLYHPYFLCVFVAKKKKRVLRVSAFQLMTSHRVDLPQLSAADLSGIKEGEKWGPKLVPLGPSKKHKGEKVRGGIVIAIEKKKL
jgi:hypothetical protein